MDPEKVPRHLQREHTASPEGEHGVCRENISVMRGLGPLTSVLTCPKLSFRLENAETEAREVHFNTQLLVVSSRKR